MKDLSTEPDDCIYLAVKMRKNSDKTHPEFALLQLPINLIGRFLRLPDKDGKSYIMYMDDVIRHCLPLILQDLITTCSRLTHLNLQRMRRWKLTMTCAPD